MTIEENLDPELVAKLDKGRKQAENGEGKITSRRKAEAVESPDTPVVPKSPYAVVGGGVQDPVMVNVDEGSAKSLSVHHIQRRLAERGFGDVYRDRDGFWREGTTDALRAFQEALGLQDADRVTVLRSLFENDDNVEIVES